MSDYSLIIATIYFASLSSTLVARLVNFKFGNIVTITIAFIAFITAGFRPWYFPDVDTYEIMYEFAALGNFDDPAYWIAHGEPGFKFFSYILSILGSNYTGFLLSMALLSWVLLIFISRLSSIPFAYLWFAYLSCYFITRDLGVIRLSIASHFIIIFFLQRKYIWQLLSIITASLGFQYFAVVAIIAKPLSRIKIEWFAILILFLLSFVFSKNLSFENIKFLIPEDRANNYAASSIVQAGGSSIIIPVARNLFFAVFIYFFMKKEIRFRQYRLWVWAAIFSVSFYIMTNGILLVAQRFSAFFGVVVPLALAYLMQRRSVRNDQFFLVVSVCVVNFISLFYFNSWLWR
jgi:hypothetical protein